MPKQDWADKKAREFNDRWQESDWSEAECIAAVASLLRGERTRAEGVVKALAALVAYVVDDNPGRAAADSHTAKLCEAARAALAKYREVHDA